MVPGTCVEHSDEDIAATQIYKQANSILDQKTMV